MSRGTRTSTRGRGRARGDEDEHEGTRTSTRGRGKAQKSSYSRIYQPLAAVGLPRRRYQLSTVPLAQVFISILTRFGGPTP